MTGIQKIGNSDGATIMNRREIAIEGSTKPPVDWGWVGEITEGDSKKQSRR